MAYKKRRSTTLEKAQSRLNGLASLIPPIDLGHGLSLQAFATLLEASSDQLQTYNIALSDVDRARIEFAETEAAVAAHIPPFPLSYSELTVGFNTVNSTGDRWGQKTGESDGDRR